MCTLAGKKAGAKLMMERKLTLAEILAIAGTRVALVAGIGLLLSSRLSKHQRKTAGIALALFGGLTTIPLALRVLSKASEERVDISPAA
jgi:predicted membrane metal-binding protein